MAMTFEARRSILLVEKGIMTHDGQIDVRAAARRDIVAADLQISALTYLHREGGRSGWVDQETLVVASGTKAVGAAIDAHSGVGGMFDAINSLIGRKLVMQKIEGQPATTFYTTTASGREEAEAILAVADTLALRFVHR